VPDKIPEHQRRLMIHDILYMRGNSGYPKSQILIGLAHRYRPELVKLTDSCLGVVRNAEGDESKARDQIIKRLAEKFNPELMNLIEDTLVQLEKDPLAASRMLDMVNEPKKEEGSAMTPKQEVKPDTSWIEAGEGSWVANTLEACMAKQNNVLSKFTEAEKKGGYGFACRLMVGKIDDNRVYSDSEDGGIFNLYFNDKGVQPKPPEVEIRNTVCIDSDTLLGIIMPDWENVTCNLVMYDKKGMPLIDNETGEVKYEELHGLQAMLFIFEAGGSENGGMEILLPQLRPSISISDAIANGKILFGGDKPDIDSEMWSKMSSSVLTDLAYPMAVKTLLNIAEQQRKK
jgi:hypothetical protein